MKEDYFISLFKSNRIGDDGALVGDFIYSKDAFFEGVHFKKSWMSHYQISTKAMMINISDAIAMNAKPRYALLSVAMPKSISKEQMRELAAGFKDVADRFGIEIIGGDTIANTKLDITITIISKVKKPLLRTGVKDGYLVAYTGELGRSKKDLQRLLNLGKIHRKSKFVNIVLREKFISRCKRYISSGMDISDGLFSDLAKLADANKIGFKLHKQISKDIACSGEEYEMLVVFDSRNKKSMIRRAKALRVDLSIFATASRVKYKNRCKAHHF